MKITWRLLFIVSVLAVAGTLLVTLAVNKFTEQQPYRGVALADVSKQIPQETKDLGTIVINSYHEYRANTVRWSAAYYGCLFGSALFSALAALFLKLEMLGERPKLRNDVAASLATLAALLVTLSSTGDFQRKWTANRVAAASMENLAYELLRPSAGANRESIVTRIQAINDARNAGIVGDVPEISPKEQRSISGDAQKGAPGDAQKATRR
jgi:hypothetical protein